MKKTIFFIVLMIILGLNFSFAQTKFGLSGGPNISSVYQDFGDDGHLETKSRVGYSFGMLLQFKFNEKLGLQTGLKYKSIGKAIDLEADLDAGESVDGFSRTILNYLDVPIMLSYQINKFKILVGPYVAVGLSGKGKFDATFKTATGEQKIKGDIPVKFGYVDDGIEYIGRKRLDYGINAGVGYSLGGFELVAIYGFGLSNIYPGQDGDDQMFDYKFHNRVVNLSVSYFFGE